MNTPQQSHPPVRYSKFDKLYINGRWVKGHSSHLVKVTDPYDDSLLAEIPGASEADLNLAFESAKKAQPRWAATAPGERAQILRNAYDIVKARKDEIVDWLIRESGSVRIKAEIEWQAVVDIMEQAVAAPYRVIGHIMPSNIPGKECRVYKKPLGVIAVISPWDFAMHLSNRSVAPALAVGNAVVLKPSSDTPVTGALMLAKIYEEAGLPSGLFNVVVGSGSEIGRPFALHPIPRLNSFTGSTKVGIDIGINSIKSPVIKKVALELGGNGPLVVLDDADMDVAVNSAVFGKFINQGQICMIANRIIVHQSIHDEFVRRFVDRVKKLKVGDPKEADTVIGPIINQQQCKGIMALVESARKEGAKEMAGGEPKGLLIPPYVFTDVTMNMTIAREEIFGPVAPIIKVRDEAEALQVANDTDAGLTGAVITQDERRGLAFALKMEVGMAHVNDQPVNDLANNPFGGEKNSGLGRFGGDWIVEEFTTSQWVTVQHTPRQYPF
ncbi:MAG: aldehyde dehydrogenase [Nitrospira sp. WS110]|nr:aldehyde dehydrogenase [Nitrospira sp. WS110]